MTQKELRCVRTKAILDRIYAESGCEFQLSYSAIARELRVSIPTVERIRRILKFRGILIEQGNTTALRYAWNTNYCCPTLEMAESITEDIPPKKQKRPLASYSIEALVEELRSRGLCVECCKKY